MTTPLQLLPSLEAIDPPLSPNDGTTLLAPASPHVDATPPHRPSVNVIAFVDLETTGLDPRRHEIIEMGIVRVDASTLNVIGECEIRVAPQRLEDADSAALAVSGFTLSEWSAALPLDEALKRASPFIEGALIAGHNVGFDWAFLEAAYRHARLPKPVVDYLRLDTASLAWPLFLTGELPSLSLDAVTKHLGIHRPTPHRALADARCALDVARRLALRMHQASPVGRWKRVYVCHPFRDAPAVNTERVRDISKRLAREGVLPIAPHLYLPAFIDEATQREQALALCLELLDTCDELRVFGERITAGMERELQHASTRGLPIHFDGRYLV